MRRLSVISCGVVAVWLVAIHWPLPEEDFRKETVQSFRVVDRNGILLREFLNDREGRGQWKPLEEISPFVRDAVIAVEDRRFHMHAGIDPLAIVRAAAENFSRGKLVSGGSTLTQQLIRNVYHIPRTFPGKCVEAWYALRLERQTAKNEILEHYLNRAPYGNQLMGVEAAARHYFGKPARDLSLAESAFLAALPNAPALLNPYRNLRGAVDRQRMVLRRMYEQKMIEKDEYDRALAQPVQVVSPEVNFRAPHLVEMLRNRGGIMDSPKAVQATLDYPLHSTIEGLVRGHLGTLAGRNVTNAAVVVIENRTMEVRALVGSADYFEARHSGQVNGALALRQPGSSIKPFTYMVALESGFSPADLLADIPTHIPDDRGDYIPENYDRRYHGPVRLRTALACSYNIPAVRLLQQVGKDALLQRLRLAGFSSLDKPASYYGYGLTLGNGEVSLLELTTAYAALANGGLWRRPKLVRATQASGALQGDEGEWRVCGEESAFLLADILSDPAARRPAFGHAFQFPFPCAVKTGTTKDYRDNWTVGFTTGYTVGVWTGNFDGSPMRGVSGLTGAGRIFSDVMMFLHLPPQGIPPGDFVPPRTLVRKDVCSRSGLLPTESCSKVIHEWIRRGSAVRESCEIHQAYRVRDEHGERVMVFEHFPPEYGLWVEEQRIPRPPPDAVRLLGSERSMKATARHDPLAILAPNSGDVFRVDPVLRREFQSIKVLGAAGMDISRAVLRVNEDEAIPFNATGMWWPMRRGVHHLALEGIRNGKKVRSETVIIHVE